MAYLIKQADVFAPTALGQQDVLIVNGVITAIDSNINTDNLPFAVEIIDANGLKLVPGFVDGHQHFTGGGGEGGYTTKVPEMTLEMNIENGVTTAIGLLGTDALSRQSENLYAKTIAFNEQGMTAKMLTGSYWHPSPTITGSIARDLAFIEPIVGLKLAISDHRGPYLSTNDIARIAAEVKNAALIAGKPGFITLHTGGLDTKLSQIIELVTEKQFSPLLFVPTHINRRSLVEQVRTLAQHGVYVDATALNETAPDGKDKMNAAELLQLALTEGWAEQLCISSDAGGSLPIWNANRTQMIGMGVGTPKSLLFELKQAVNERGISLTEALKPMTENPAKIYQFNSKGQLQVNYDADCLLLNENLDINTVFAKGKALYQANKSQ